MADRLTEALAPITLDLWGLQRSIPSWQAGMRANLLCLDQALRGLLSQLMQLGSSRRS